MEKLNNLRQEINEIDKDLVDLFIKRMKLVNDVAEYKMKNSMQILDKNRETLIINKYTENIKDKSLKSSVKEFFESLMHISKRVQKEIIHKHFNVSELENERIEKVGFQGVEGSFSHEALIEYFGAETKKECFSNFKDVFEALKNGEVKYGILPIENLSTGGISEVYDLLGEYGCYIVGEKCIKVDHNLIGVKGAQLSDIKEVYSHMQGFLQSKEFFDNNNKWMLIPYFNTAKSAMHISKENLKTKACVASKNAADIYGLNILKKNINDNSNNYTRFIIIARDIELNAQCDKITMLITLPHKAGTLCSILQHFLKNNSNMLKIESRPIEGKKWEYLFYIDFEGNILDENTKNVLKAIEEESVVYKFLGNYKAEVN